MIILKLTIDGGLNMLKTYKSFFLPLFLVVSYALGNTQVSGTVTNKDGEALSYDNIATVVNVTDPTNGQITESNGLWIYTPNNYN